LRHQPGDYLVEALAAVFGIQFQGDGGVVGRTGTGFQLGIDVLIQVGVERHFRRIRRCI
jgi:hypothetical protein